MKKLIVLAGLVLFLTSCSSDNNTTPTPVNPSFTFDNQTYTLLPGQGINEIQQNGFITFNDIPYNRSSISIIGMLGFAQTSTISFDLYYREGTTLAGTYTIYDTDNDNLGFEDFVSPLNRGCMGWTSMGEAYPIAGGQSVNANNPAGTVTITVNSANNYTIQYNGNFRIYNDDFAVVRTVPCVMNVTGAVTQQN